MVTERYKPSVINRGLTEDQGALELVRIATNVNAKIQSKLQNNPDLDLEKVFNAAVQEEETRGQFATLYWGWAENIPYPGAKIGEHEIEKSSLGAKNYIAEAMRYELRVHPGSEFAKFAENHSGKLVLSALIDQENFRIINGCYESDMSDHIKNHAGKQDVIKPGAAAGRTS